MRQCRAVCSIFGGPINSPFNAALGDPGAGCLVGTGIGNPLVDFPDRGGIRWADGHDRRKLKRVRSKVQSCERRAVCVFFLCQHNFNHDNMNQYIGKAESAGRLSL